MARGVNKVIIIGNLGNDPDCRTSQSGNLYAQLSVATDESYKDRQTGQIVPKTEWHRVILSARLAEIAQQYTRKGSKVYIEGRLQTRKWQDNGGQDRYTTEIKGYDLQLLDANPNNQGQQNQSAQQPQQRQQYQQPSQRPQYAGGQPSQAPQPAQDDDFSDDIPF